MFHYILRQPKSKTTNPKALLMIHGYGSNEQDLFSFAGQLPNDLLIISVRAPYNLDFGGYAWYDIYLDAQNNKVSDNVQAIESVEKLSQFIDILIDKHNIDKHNFNLLGFSQGAILSYALAFNYPEKINKIIALSGYINEEIMLQKLNTEKLSHLNFFISHGKYDEVIPVEAARQILPYLDKHNVKYSYNEYTMGHEVNMSCFEDMQKWIIKNL